jgi:hypothetical protein
MIDHHGHEHEFEPQHGLPERLPPDERILWQGSPSFGLLATSAFHVRKVAIYFALLMAWSVASSLADGLGMQAALRHLALAASVYALCLVCLLTMAWWSARTTVYTLTNKRVVMRIGIVLSLTFNLPLKKLAGAAFLPRGQGRGDVALEIAGSDRIGWAHLWPHVRPWQLKSPQPMLRALNEGEAVARQLAEAWAAATGSSLPAAAAQPEAGATPDLVTTSTPASTPTRRPAGFRPSPSGA